MDLTHCSLSSQIVSGTQSSIWMKHVSFKKAEAADCAASAMPLKCKYSVMRPDGVQVNGFAKSALSSNGKNNTTCKADTCAAGFSQREVLAEDVPKPKIRISSPDSVLLNWQKMTSIGAGLVNLGNTCFMNSVLQCLTYCPPLVNYLMFSENEHSTSPCSNFCMACHLLTNMRRCFQSPGGVVKPLEIAQRLKSVAKHFQLGRQEDAHEYLRHAIDSMCRTSVSQYESRHPPLKLDAGSKETTAFNHIFGGYLRSQVTCMQCKSRSNTYDHFMDLMLDIKNVVTIEKALEKFTKAEELQNENAYKCPKCKKKGQATKRFSVHQPPNVVTIQLKRFEFNRFSGKITKHIQFPENLDLRPYMSDTTGDRLMYRLNAVLVHLGFTCNSGHYFCYVRNSNNHWYRMDDDRVQPVPVNQVLNQNAYILFYVKAETGVTKAVANGSVPAHKALVVRTPTPVPPASKVTPIINSGTGLLPHPFSTPPTVVDKVPPVSAPAALSRGPKIIICEPSPKKPSVTNGAATKQLKPAVTPDEKHTKKSAPTNLVPYDSSDEETEADASAQTNGRLSILISNGDNNEAAGDAINSNSSQSSSTSKPNQNGKLRNGVSHATASSFDLKRLETQSLQSFGPNVTDWAGNKNHIDQHLDREKRSANLLDEDELYNQEYDRGKVKKIKTQKLEKSDASARNPFDVYRGRAKSEPGKSMDRSGRWNGKNGRKYPGRGGGHSRGANWIRRSQQRRHEYR